MNRQERLLQTADQKKSQQLSNQIAQEKLQLQAHLLETQSKVSGLEQHLENLKSSKFLSVVDIIKCQDDITSYKNGIKSIKALQKELYS
jgi:hypothetical protein